MTMGSIYERTVFVGGTRDADESNLENYFKKFGEISEVDVVRGPNGRSRGFGFIRFSSKRAVDLILRDAFHTLESGVRVNTRPYDPPGGGRAHRSSPPRHSTPPRSPIPQLAATPPRASSPPFQLSEEQRGELEEVVTALSRLALWHDLQPNANISNQPNSEGSAPAASGGSNSLSLCLGERVVYLDDETWEHGVVRWIGQLNIDEPDEQIHAGLQLDRPVGTGTGKFKDRQVFTAPMKHATFVPLDGLLREADFLGEGSSEHFEEVNPNSADADSNGQNNNNNNSLDCSDCQICFERQSNSAFYKCGHSSFCYECALAVKNTEPALCPVCRVPIVDVLRLYK